MSTMRIDRVLALCMTDSALLLGPRGVGKSTLLRDLFDPSRCLWIDLLSSQQEERYLRNPDTLMAEVEAMSINQTFVIIDEIQKIPKLLDVVHKLIESTDKIFVLTGSSARKLKKGASNLLAGRAFIYNMSTLTARELGSQFDLDVALSFGMLPKIYHYQASTQRNAYLKSYSHTYLKEEVWAEQFIRDKKPFRYFLEVAAQCNGKILNFSKIARDVGVDHKTVENYYSILEDTMLGFYLQAYDGSFRKQISKSPKFYLFDTGVARALSRMLSVPVRERTHYYGELFECFIITEIQKTISYFQDEYRLSYLRTKTNQELDLIVQRPGQKTLLIEIKSSTDVQPEQLRAMNNLLEEIPNSEAICLSRDINKKKFGDIIVWPWQEAIHYYFG